ncbi:MAG: alpha-amylase family glycosyl hydrolase, partial [Sediminibacterium sp.]|nr:alpha-amylase family glycosyl hydrolase [Sediminibacterium sp.]
IVLFCFLVFFINSSKTFAQGGSSPLFITDNDPNFNISIPDYYGNRALEEYSGSVFIYVGLITNRSSSHLDWKYVKFPWGSTNPLAKLQNQFVDNGPYNGGRDASRTFKYKLANVANYYNGWSNYGNQTIRQFFGVTDPTEKILKIAFLLYDSTQTKIMRNADGSDMYINVYESNNYTLKINPYSHLLDSNYGFINYPIYLSYFPREESYLTRTFYPNNIGFGDTLNFSALANLNSTIKTYYNDILNGNSSNVQQVNFQYFIVNKLGLNKILFKGTTSDGRIATDSIMFNVNLSKNTKILPLPANVEEGINYELGDTSVVLVQYAPFKGSMMVIGDFPQSNWQPNIKYLMNRTPDGNRFWIRISGLTPKQEYTYQFVIDSNLKVADMWSYKVLDPWNDSFIPAQTYPNLKRYPYGLTTGIASVLQTAQTKYDFNIKNFQAPPRNKLVIYELLIRDFLANANYQTLIDTLNYLKTLGVNAIELLPVTEFEGNLSWGYNVAYHFAVDKYYGTETD